MAFPASCFCHVKSAALKTLLNNFQRLTKTQNLLFTSVLNSNKLTLSSPHSPSLTYPIKTIFTSSISCNPNDSLPQTKDGTEEQRPDLSRDVSPADDIRSQVVQTVASLPITERLFAVVQVDGKQFRVSQDDILTVPDWLIADVGERIRLEKVLLAGGRDFSLIGRPLLKRTQVYVEATVMEKTLSPVDIIRRFRQRSRFMRTYLTRNPITYLRINSVKVLSPE